MKIGIIGFGNMGSSIVKGMISGNIIEQKDIFVYDKISEKTQKLNEQEGINVSPCPKHLIDNVDIVILAVKPNTADELFEQIKESITKDHLIISIIAGLKIEKIENKLGKDKKIVRVMPNTPALVLEAMSAISFNSNINDKDKENSIKIFSSFGKAEVVKENLMDIVTGISGSSPAYVFIMIEAMADAAVRGGMPREKAYTFVSQAILGSAKMVLETNTHPAMLKDMVTSPGGTTIEAIKVLEKNGFRNSLMEAIEKATEKSIDLGK